MDQRTMYGALLALGAATVYEAQGAKGALDSGIKPIDPGSRLVGPALTVDTRPADNLMLHYALLKARPGDVLVVDAKGFLEAGPWGDVLTAAAMKAGIAGLVINGAVRDASTIVEMGFPVFCRGLSIKGTGKGQPGKLNVPVCIGNVVIRPGDVIVGDRDGVVVVSPDELASVLANGQEREAKETEFRSAIARGASTVELLGLMPTLERLGF
jgi:4-hydroxy-4-methyl-2-oxoglutarate aldolase